LIFDLIEGENLESFVLNDAFKNIKSLPQRRKAILSMFREIVEAIRFLHSAGIIHSDIKHKNIMVETKTNTPFIIDLGSGIEANNQV
jgi:serine/threonine protein kinase